jgi:UDP-glucose 4-epimerase
VKIVVTGAAGFIASNLIPRLLANGDEVYGFDNFFLGKREYLIEHKRFRFYEQDLLELDRVAGLFDAVKPDLVWHLAANSDISFGTKYTDFDLKGGTLVTYNVLESMRRAGTPRIIFSSSGAVYGEPTVLPTPEHYGPLFPISLYAASKLACEGLITAFAHNYGIGAWIFRFGNIVGPKPTHGVIYDFVLRLRDDPTKLIVLGDGTQSKPYVHVDDCLDGMMFGHAHAREEVNCYNLAVDGHTSVRQITEWTLEEMGLRDVVPQYGTSPRGWKGDVAQVRMDTSRMTALGWTPKRTSDEAVRQAIRETVAQLAPRS